ncbi:MAG: hypothetical protein ACREN3_04630, partial [Gemmatimonadaceae bacterium]
MTSAPGTQIPDRRNSSSLEVLRDSVENRSELGDALRHAQADAQAEAILWQRWLRYLGVLLALLVMLLFGSVPRDVALLPTLLVSGAYIAIVILTSWWVQRSERGVLHPVLPGLLVTADILAMTGFFYFSTYGP